MDDKRLLVIDTETTGLRRGHDQVIELAVQAGLAPSGPRHTWRFRPSVPIHPEALAVHGISVEDLRDERPFSHYAVRLRRMVDGASVIVGYNVWFDLAMLQAEFRRSGVGEADLSSRLVVDPYRIWCAAEPRGLREAHRRFVGSDFDGAHRAQADAAATAAVLTGMLPVLGLDGAGWEHLAGLCAERPMLGSTGTEPSLSFGRHAGAPLSEVARTDHGYLEWVLRGDFPPGVKAACREALEAVR